MPPTGKLSESQIATLTEWIRLGAPMPKDHGGGSGVSVRKTRGVITDEDRQWWAFRPIERPSMPIRSVSEGFEIQKPEFRIQNAIDSFIAAKLIENGLSPAP